MNDGLKFTHYNSLLPNADVEQDKYFTDLLNTWQPLDIRQANKELDGVEPEETIDIIANKSDGSHVVVCRIKNDVNGNNLTDEDEANAVLIARAPSMLIILKVMYGLIMRGAKIEKNSPLMQYVGWLTQEVTEGKAHYQLKCEFEKREEPKEPELTD